MARDKWITEFIKQQEEKMNRSTTRTENGVEVFYPSNKAIYEGIKRSMA